MKTILCLSLLYFWGLLAANSQTVQPREKYNFNAGWKMAIGDKPGNERIDADDHDWQKITLPHAFNENDAFKKSIEELSTGIAWYRKNFKLP